MPAVVEVHTLEFVLCHNNVLFFILPLISYNIVFACWISAVHAADVFRELSAVTQTILPWAIADLDSITVYVSLRLFFLFVFLCTYRCWISSAVLSTSHVSSGHIPYCLSLLVCQKSSWLARKWQLHVLFCGRKLWWNFAAKFCWKRFWQCDNIHA